MSDKNKITEHIEKMSMPADHVMVQSVAIEEVKKFVEYHTDKTILDDEVLEGYPDIVLAMQRGLLDFTDPDSPKLKLKAPIKLENGDIDTAELTFKTRMKASTKESLFKGLNVAQEQTKFMNISKAYFAGLSTRGMLDKLGKFDERVVDQMSSLFM